MGTVEEKAHATSMAKSMAYIFMADSVSRNHRLELKAQFVEGKTNAQKIGKNPVRMWQAICTDTAIRKGCNS
eukprot:m.747300 g.747300  ORF g.747300 m.747300 type:complete len:72 (-) comp23143_c1_seq18:2454-2669(-)